MGPVAPTDLNGVGRRPLRFGKAAHLRCVTPPRVGDIRFMHAGSGGQGDKRREPMAGWKTRSMRSERLSGAEGVRWIPERPSGTAALVVAGSSGRVDSARAELLARHGAVAESIRWFGGQVRTRGRGKSPGAVSRSSL
jgi:hypothetical protein